MLLVYLVYISTVFVEYIDICIQYIYTLVYIYIYRFMRPRALICFWLIAVFGTMRGTSLELQQQYHAIGRGRQPFGASREHSTMMFISRSIPPYAGLCSAVLCCAMLNCTSSVCAMRSAALSPLPLPFLPPPPPPPPLRNSPLSQDPSESLSVSPTPPCPQRGLGGRAERPCEKYRLLYEAATTVLYCHVVVCRTWRE